MQTKSRTNELGEITIEYRLDDGRRIFAKWTQVRCGVCMVAHVTDVVVLDGDVLRNAYWGQSTIETEGGKWLEPLGPPS